MDLSTYDLFKSTTIDILDLFEELLNFKNITIPSDDREGLPEEARLYGSDYYEMEDLVYCMLKDRFKKRV